MIHQHASGTALGAILYQKQHELKRVISYACVKRYRLHNHEFLGSSWTVNDKSKDYLYNSNFTVLTNNNAMLGVELKSVGIHTHDSYP